jgi:hypothetical protein
MLTLYYVEIQQHGEITTYKTFNKITKREQKKKKTKRKRKLDC